MTEILVDYDTLIRVFDEGCAVFKLSRSKRSIKGKNKWRFKRFYETLAECPEFEAWLASHNLWARPLGN